MANVKYKVVEFKPTTNQKAAGMTHAWMAKAVINNTISNVELADKIAKRTGFKAYEASAIISAFAEVASEELLESNSIQVCDEKGTQVLTLSPSVSGSVSDTVIKDETTAAHAKDSSVAIRTVAEESDVTPNRLSWTIDARVGTNFSKAFAQNKSAKKVKVGYTEVVETPTDTEETPTTPPIINA